MVSYVQTALLCDRLKKSDGRSDNFKQRLIQALRQCVDRDDAINAVKMILTYDWRREELVYYGYSYSCHNLDYEQIVDTFWKLWRRKAVDYELTYVRCTYKYLPNPSKGVMTDSWTYMNIFVGDTHQKVSRYYFTPNYPYQSSNLINFQADRKTVANWIRKWQNIESTDARITVQIFGSYGNRIRNHSRQFFDYELAVQ